MESPAMPPTENNESRPPNRVRVRVVVLLVVATILVYLATWVGPIAFYFDFQRKLLAQKDDPAYHSVLWTEVDEVPAGDSSPWQVHEVDARGLRLALPPGDLESIRSEGEMIEVRFKDGGALIAQGFPRGFIGSLMATELERTGGTVTVRPDAEILREIVVETPDSYRLRWSEDERSLYAARLLTKMLLWEIAPVRKTTLSRIHTPPATAVIVEYEDREPKIFVTDGDGTLVLMLQEGYPSEWIATPAKWIRPPAGKVDD